MGLDLDGFQDVEKGIEINGFWKSFNNIFKLIKALPQ